MCDINVYVRMEEPHVKALPKLSGTVFALGTIM